MLTLHHRIADEADFSVWYKPAGLSVHSEQGEGFVAAASRLAKVPYYPVHRLDQGTSGLLVLAKSSQAAALFGELFATQQMEKYYLAIAIGKPKQKQGWVKGDMAPARAGNYKLLTSLHYPAVSYFISHGIVGDGIPHGARLYLIKPWSGKTHQIRVALKAKAAAIAGDPRYGGAAADRLYLHALALRFSYQGQQYIYQVAPREGEWFVHDACRELLSTTWPDAPSLCWPQYQKPRSL